MATTPRRAGSETAASAPFSYAQAAKGLSSAPAPSTTPSKPSSGSVTPSKEAPPSAMPPSASASWADDTEANDARSEQTSGSREFRAQPPVAASKAAAVPQVATASTVSSPDLSASTASTVTKDDDVSSIPNTSSDSTWENKSQASTSVEKSVDSNEKTSEKGKGKNVERAPAKPLQDAPIPVVNIWKQRAEEAKVKAAQKPSTAKPAPAASSTPPNGTFQGAPPMAKQTRTPSADASDLKEKASMNEGKVKAHEEEKTTPTRKDSKPEVDSDKAKKTTKVRSQEKEMKAAPTALPLPPDRDQEAWPTPDTAVDEDRKKAQEKTEKERKEPSTGKPGGKKEWVNMAITPNVIFNTPLPNSASSRRGGRGAGRGGAQTGGRTSGFAPEKDGSSPGTLPNGDQPKRGRPDGSIREASPKGKRTVSSGSPPLKDKAVTPNGEKSSKAAPSETEAPSRRTSIMTEPGSNGPISGQNNTFPRQYASNRPSKARRGEFPGQDRRKDGDSVSPTKENGGFHDRRVSSTTQTDVPDDIDRRASNPEGQTPAPSKRGSNDRQFGSFSGRDRNRGGARGGRGSYQNGHQFANGHAAPLKSSSTFPGPLSPTSFTPDPNAYFAPPGRYRNGPRSHSVTTESMYRMPAQFGGPQQVAPIHTAYMGGMYDFPMVQPMSAVPYNSFGMDHMTLLSMVTTQLEYYFSVDNLCRDIYLRKHMDSKGFVFLSVIAEFNRIKQLTTDIELIKYVCYQSRSIEFRIGHDGKDRIRCHEGWEKWVLPVPDRDASAQNDGPEELYSPPMPHPHGFDSNGVPRYPDMPAGSPTAPGQFGSEAPYPLVNGFHPGAPQHTVVASSDATPNGTAPEGVNGTAIANGHPIDNATKAVSVEPDSFSDEQVKSLTVVVRKQDQPQMPALPPSATRTFSNGSIDSRSGVPDASEKITGRKSVKVNGIGPSLGVESKMQEPRGRTLSPLVPASATGPVRLYWVKDKDSPVDFVPPDSTHESYSCLRSKALLQRENNTRGCCPYDMDVLYQFWSHFLIRNFNARMYDEFRHFAFEDAANNLSDVGITNLIKFYGESLLSSQNLIRECVARDYVDLVRSETEQQRPAFEQLRSTLRNGTLDPRNRRRVSDFLDAELRASLE